MSFEDWVNFDWVRREPTSTDETRALLGVVDRFLHDADVEAISDDLRFTAAFQAALTAANLALRASGYRALTGPGHHQHVAESMELTIGADAAVIRKMRAFSKKRNTASYDVAGSIPRADVEDAIRFAITLRAAVVEWMEREHPELLP